MTINLRPDQEQLISEVIRTGAYQDTEAVIDRALEALRSDEEWLNRHKEEIAGKIERAFEQFERGEFLSAQESRADMAKRKAEWLRNRQL